MRIKIAIVLLLALLAGLWAARGQTIIGRPLMPLFSGEDYSSLTNGLVAYWPMDEASGSRIDEVDSLTLVQTGTVDANTGKISLATSNTVEGNRLSMSGSMPTNLFFNPVVPYTNSATVGAWVKLFALETRYVVNKAGATEGDTIGLLYNAATGQFNGWFRYPAGGYVTAVTTGLSIVTNQWYFLAFWFDYGASTVNLQVDNGTVFSASGTWSYDANNFFGVGSYQANPIYDWKGQLDEFGMWRRVLTADERTQLYNSGDGLTCCNPGFYYP